MLVHGVVEAGAGVEIESAVEKFECQKLQYTKYGDLEYVLADHSLLSQLKIHLEVSLSPTFPKL